MMGGDFQKPLQLLATKRKCVFEDDVCVNPSDVPYGRRTYANITFLELFVGPYANRREVVDEGPDHAAALVFGVLCWAMCPPYVGVLDD